MLTSRYDSGKEAVARAVEFARNMLDSSPGDLPLEEVELGKIGPNDVWLITLEGSRNNNLYEAATGIL